MNDTKESAGDLFGLGVGDVEAALAIFRRCHDLIHKKMGTPLLDSIFDTPATPDDGKKPSKSWIDGYTNGLSRGIACFPSTIEEIPIGEILEAVRGKAPMDSE